MHIPVLLNEAMEYLAPKPGENFIDCTLGEGGHTLAILRKNGPRGRVLGIDRDEQMLESTKHKIANSEFNNRAILVCDNFANLKEIIKKENFDNLNGILLDIGMSSWHLEESGRGFSFKKNELLDMRYSQKDGITARDILNTWNKDQIEKILKEYGEEKFSRIITEKIIQSRKIAALENTFQLVEIVRKSIPRWYQNKKIHFATKTFQALRIAVNGELENLKNFLSQSEKMLESGGRLVIISFHSLEDRIVKNFLKEKSQEGLFKILTKKPVEPQRKEIMENPRARSAKLRAAVKI